MEGAVSIYTNGHVPKRAGKYDSLKNQLDALWHDIDAGKFGEDAKSGEFYQHIKAIKEEFPKGS